MAKDSRVDIFLSRLADIIYRAFLFFLYGRTAEEKAIGTGGVLAMVAFIIAIISLIVFSFKRFLSWIF